MVSAATSSTPGPLKVAVHIEDADEFAARYTIEAFRGRIGGTAEDVVQTAVIDGNTPAGRWVEFSGVSLAQPGEFVYFRITQSSAKAWIVWDGPSLAFRRNEKMMLVKCCYRPVDISRMTIIECIRGPRRIAGNPMVHW